jgi:hypothetical protein
MERNDLFLAGCVLVAVAAAEGFALGIAGATSANAAAWAQALGTVAAVLVAVYAPSIAARRSRMERDEERIRLTVAALNGLWVSTVSLGERVFDLIGYLDRQKGVPPDGQNWDHWFERASVNVPAQYEFFHQQAPTYDQDLTRVYRQISDGVMAYNSGIAIWKAMGSIEAGPAWENTRQGMVGQLMVVGGMFIALADIEGREDWKKHLVSRIPPEHD